MPLVTSTEMFKKAYDGGYAIGAFNVNNMEIVQGITEACQEEHAPVILQVSKGARAYANHTYLVKLVEAAVECCPDIPIVLHLDHGPDFETCKACIDGGFTSVMIDASSKPFAENIALTRQVVEYAHDVIGENRLYEKWSYGHDGASLICQLLFEEATDINFFVGRAINPAHQNPDLPINFSIKMNLVKELSECLRKMGKRIKVSYF